jgi:hypothetical protein
VGFAVKILFVKWNVFLHCDKLERISLSDETRELFSNAVKKNHFFKARGSMKKGMKKQNPFVSPQQMRRTRIHLLIRHDMQQPSLSPLSPSSENQRRKSTFPIILSSARSDKGGVRGIRGRGGGGEHVCVLDDKKETCNSTQEGSGGGER